MFMKGSFFVFFIFCCTNIFAQTDIVKYLPKGYVTDGSIDYTVYLQKGIDENKNVLMPNFPVLVNKRGLNLNSNQTVAFQSNSVIKMKPNAEPNYGVLNLVNIKNVKILDPHLIGDKDKHLSRSGEWGMGINILSSGNISITNPKISKMWGDGIYIGEINYKFRPQYNLENYFSTGILIRGGLIDDNRRNGISVISVKGLSISGTIIQNTAGTMPMAGIDIEPNDNGQFLEDIILSNIITKNNAEIGIKYVPVSFFGDSKKTVTITIENCHDIGSKTGLVIGGAKGGYKGPRQDGRIIVKHFKSESNITPVSTGSIQYFSPKIEIQNLSIYRKKTRDLKSEQDTKKSLLSRGMDVN